MNALLMSMPGTPIIYYGDEIGMGDNIYLGDRNGVRTPMQWSSDRNAGFSEADTAALYSPLIVDPPYGYHTINVVAQERVPTSLLRWMRRLIAVRKQYQAFGRGAWEAVDAANRRVLVFLRSYRDETILCVNNLSRFAQFVELDLRRFTGLVPLELWSKQSFPPVGELPYLLTLGPHNFFWFRLLPGDQAKEIQRSG
jgi:maltose alpha-D-glucosyltransferase/alpha-amylase